MWGNHSCVKLPPALNMEFVYNNDMLEMIRWPYTEEFSTEEFLHYMSSYYKGCIGPYRGRLCQNFDSDSDCDECDETLMVTSNDALRFEEDCLFESPPPTARNVQSPGTVDVDSNRFLCQKTSTADMTLAELNDSNACDVGDEKIGLNIPKTVSAGCFDQNSDSLDENPFASGSRSSVKSIANKECVSFKRSTSSRQPNGGGNSGIKLLFTIKTELEDPSDAAHGSESNVKAEPSSEKKCSLQTTKELKRRRAVSASLTESESKIDSAGGFAIAKSSSFSIDLFTPEKKLKLETSDGSDKDHRAGSHLKASSSTSRAAYSKTDEADSCDDLSDAESLSSKSSVQDLLKSSGMEKRYFWQYNIQAKGPKEKRLCRNVGHTDPHVLKHFEDPVFDSSQSDTHFIHSGKARKGDGTDITPNPRKLLHIGNELKTLNSTIDRMMQSADAAARVNTMKEKNKYASRVCRLKKKAQHEANKIKLQGLNEEHNQLMFVLNSIKRKLKEHKKSFKDVRRKINFTEELDGLVKSGLKVNVAGQADDYVSSILLSSRSSSSLDDQNESWLYSD